MKYTYVSAKIKRELARLGANSTGRGKYLIYSKTGQVRFLGKFLILNY